MRIPYSRVTKLYFCIHRSKTYTLKITQKTKPNHNVNKFQRILIKFPNLHIVWTEKKNLSHPDLLSRSLTTTAHEEHRLRTVEDPDSIKFVMKHNQQINELNRQNTIRHFLNTR